MTTTTWDPAESYNVTLSGGNLVAAGSSFNFNAARSTTKKLIGVDTNKYYFEIACNNSFSDNRSCFGFCTEATTIFGGGAPSAGGGTIADLNKPGTTINIDGTGFATTSFGNIDGQTFGVAVDMSTSKIWYTNDGVHWNASSSGDNPATGQSACKFNTTSLGTKTDLFIYCAPIDTGAAFTLNTGNSPFSFSIPSGFVSWDAVVQLPSKSYGRIIY